MSSEKAFKLQNGIIVRENAEFYANVIIDGSVEVDGDIYKIANNIPLVLATEDYVDTALANLIVDGGSP